MIDLPESCPRGRTDCEPLSQIIADELDDGVLCFICVGLNDGETRAVEGDIFRHCWRNSDTDEMGDWDHRDLIDTISVMSQALSIDANMSVAGDTL